MLLNCISDTLKLFLYNISKMEKNEDFTVDECIKVKPPSTVNINHNGFTSHPPLTQLLPPFLAISAICLTVVEIH